jgi:hypothetical protein
MNRLSTSLRSDLVIVAGLVALGVAARLLPHEPNFTPIAASTLFAATVLRTRLLAFAVPVLALVISDIVLASEMTSIRTVVYAMFMLPAVVAFLPERTRALGMFVPAIIAHQPRGLGLQRHVPAHRRRARHLLCGGPAVPAANRHW